MQQLTIKKSLLTQQLTREQDISKDITCVEQRVIEYLEGIGVQMLTQVIKADQYFNQVKQTAISDDSTSTPNSSTPLKFRKGSLALQNSKLFSRRKLYTSGSLNILPEDQLNQD